MLCMLHTADLQAPCRASPEIAPYPFTTLMPNLGVLAASRQKANPEEDFTNTDFLLADPSGSSMGGGMSSASGPVLADLPGLIQGAHAGRGLGRMFLRHLRRTRGLLHVIDASAGSHRISSPVSCFQIDAAGTSLQTSAFHSWLLGWQISSARRGYRALVDHESCCHACECSALMTWNCGLTRMAVAEIMYGDNCPELTA